MRKFNLDDLESVSGGIALRTLQGQLGGAPEVGVAQPPGMTDPLGTGAPLGNAPIFVDPNGGAAPGFPGVQQQGAFGGFQPVATPPGLYTQPQAQPAPQQQGGNDFLAALPTILNTFTSLIGALNGTAPRAAAPAATPREPAAPAPAAPAGQDEASLGPPQETPGGDGAMG